MIEGQQRPIGDARRLDYKPALLAIDDASTHERRILDRLLAAQY